MMKIEPTVSRAVMFGIGVLPGFQQVIGLAKIVYGIFLAMRDCFASFKSLSIDSDDLILDGDSNPKEPVSPKAHLIEGAYMMLPLIGSIYSAVKCYREGAGVSRENTYRSLYYNNNM